MPRLPSAGRLKDEEDRTYNLDVLAGLKANEALVPFLWTYEMTNGLVMAHRRKRLAESEITTILESLKALPITVDSPDADLVMHLPAFALKHQLKALTALTSSSHFASNFRSQRRTRL